MPPTPLRSTLATAVAATLLLSAPAAAETLIGSDLSRAPTRFTLGQVAFTQLGAPPDALPIVAPSSGVLVRIRLRHGIAAATAGTVDFRILSGPNPFGARPATPDGSDQPIALQQGVGDGMVDYRPKDPSGRPIGVPIAAGERLAVEQLPDGPAGVDLLANAPAAYLTGSHVGAHGAGDAQYLEFPNELLLQGTIEPDADGDGRGDESQDPCPTRPNDPLTGNCPDVIVEVPGPERIVEVPGPERVVEVPGPERVVEVPGPERTVQVPGPERVTQVSVPGPTRDVERVLTRCRVPSVKGLTRVLARRVLTAAGCKLGKAATKTVRRGRAGRAVAQSPKAGSVARVGTKIAITLSKRARR